MIIAAAPASVQSTPANANAVEPLNLGHYLDPMLDSPNPQTRAYAFRVLARQSAAEPTAPAVTEPDVPSWEDVQWWSANAPDAHTGGCHPDALTPEEEDAELEYNDRLNAAYEAMYEAEMIETGIPCW